MLSGLSGLFHARPEPTRFERTKTFAEPLKILHKLRKKESELKAASESMGEASIDCTKYLAIKRLMRRLDDAIKEFNDTKPSATDNEHETLEFARKLSGIVTSSRSADNKALMTPRNDQRKNLSNIVYYGTFGATYVAGSAVSIGTLGKLATLLYIAPTVSNSVYEATGLNDLSPGSIRLLNELSTKLDAINENLSKKLGIGEIDNTDEFDDFTCLITQEIMKDPVVCTLDGRAYERQAIERWLREHGTSPYNRKEIPPGKSVNDVLIKHFNFNSIVDRFRREHPFAEQGESLEFKPAK